MSRTSVRAALMAAASATAFSPASAQTVQENVTITGARSVAERDNLPSTSESVTRGDLRDTVNVINTEDALKYLPSIVVRKRHSGDTQAPISTRTSGVGSSARSLIFADGVLLSALIGNNNSFASPRWGMVAPEDIERVDVLYGPFAAQYAGNSIGAVVEIATHMPDSLVASARVQSAWQNFSQYGTSGDYPSYEVSALAGDRIGDFAWRVSVNHLDARNQPLSYVTASRPASTSVSGTPVDGAFDALNRSGAPIAVLGAGGLEYQRQDNLTAKFTYRLTSEIEAAYTLGLFLNDDRASVETYLRDGSGAPIYAGSVNIGGYNYSVASSAFSNSQYRLDETHWMHAATLTSARAAWDWQVAASLYDYGEDTQRAPSTALPGALTGGAGSITRMDGTGWYTADAKAAWHPGGMMGAHRVSFGAHLDRYTLSSEKYGTIDWIDGPEGAATTASKGKTSTYALWAQEVWRLDPQWSLTLGGRYEWWRAFDGMNYSASPALSIDQPSRSDSAFSPKAALSWQGEDVKVTLSYGDAYRFPTVSELYQAITTGATLTVPNPDLLPEHAQSAELAFEHAVNGGMIRFSLFGENLSDALISQSAPLVTGSTTLYNYVQNIDHVRSYGAELSLKKEDVLVRGLSLQGSVTYVDPRIVSDPVLPVAEGKQLPQVPHWRATAVAIYRPDEAWSFTLAARYSDPVYATIDNSDAVGHTWQGFEGYFVLDARATWNVDDHWSLAAGVDNLNGRDYFLFHPFPARTFVAELRYAY